MVQPASPMQLPGLQPEAEPLRIDPRGVAGDHPVPFQPLHPAQAGRGRQADPFGEVGVAQPALALEFGQQGQVGAIQADSVHFLSLCG